MHFCLKFYELNGICKCVVQQVKWSKEFSLLSKLLLHRINSIMFFSVLDECLALFQQMTVKLLSLLIFSVCVCVFFCFFFVFFFFFSVCNKLLSFQNKTKTNKKKKQKQKKTIKSENKKKTVVIFAFFIKRQSSFEK